MKNGNMQKSFFEKLETLKRGLSERFSGLDVRNLSGTMSRLAHYHYNKKKFFIMGRDKEIYDFLMENSYNPFTVYRWFLLERVPDDIKFQVKTNQLSQKQAINQAYQRRHETTDTLSLSIRKMGLDLIRGM